MKGSTLNGVWAESEERRETLNSSVDLGLTVGVQGSPPSESSADRRILHFPPVFPHRISSCEERTFLWASSLSPVL